MRAKAKESLGPNTVGNRSNGEGPQILESKLSPLFGNKSDFNVKPRLREGGSSKDIMENVGNSGNSRRRKRFKVSHTNTIKPSGFSRRRSGNNLGDSFAKVLKLKNVRKNIRTHLGRIRKSVLWGGHNEGGKRSLDKESDSREGFVSDIIFASGNLLSMRTSKENVIVSMSLKSKNLGLFLSQSRLLKGNNVRIESKDQMSIRGKGITIIGNDMNPVLQQALPGATLKYGVKLSRGIINRGELRSIINHIGVRISRRRLSSRSRIARS